MASGSYPEFGSGGGGDLTAVASADGSITITSSTGPVPDFALTRSQATGIPGPWTAVTVTGAAVTDITISGLTGDTDGGYEVFFDILGDSGTPNLTLQPNGVSTNQTGVLDYNNGTTVAASNRTALTLGFCGRSAPARARGHFYFTSKTGLQRQLMLHSSHTGVGTGIASEQHFTGAITWKETSTVITSLVVHSDVASGIAIGSVVYWRKMFGPF